VAAHLASGPIGPPGKCMSGSRTAQSAPLVRMYMMWLCDRLCVRFDRSTCEQVLVRRLPATCRRHRSGTLRRLLSSRSRVILFSAVDETLTNFRDKTSEWGNVRNVCFIIQVC